MTETETEAQTLQRLENALRRIGELARQPRPPEPDAPEVDRTSLLHSLDLLITRLRSGLESPTLKPSSDGVPQ